MSVGRDEAEGADSNRDKEPLSQAPVVWPGCCPASLAVPLCFPGEHAFPPCICLVSPLSPQVMGIKSTLTLVDSDRLGPNNRRGTRGVRLCTSPAHPSLSVDRSVRRATGNEQFGRVGSRSDELNFKLPQILLTKDLE